MADFVNYQSPYAVADNNPIAYVDVYGLGSGIGDWLRRLFGGGCSCKKNPPAVLPRVPAPAKLCLVASMSQQ